MSSLKEGPKYVLFISASIALSPMPRTKLVLDKDGQMNRSKGEYGERGQGRRGKNGRLLPWMTAIVNKSTSSEHPGSPVLKPPPASCVTFSKLLSLSVSVSSSTE